MSETVSILNLEKEAFELGVPVVVGTGFAPGLSCVLASYGKTLLEEIEEIHVSKMGTGGPSCALVHHRALSRVSFGWRDDKWYKRFGGSGRELLWFPEPVGPQDCYHAALSDPILLHNAFPEVSRISAKMAATRRMSVIVSRALPDARDGLKPVHRRILWGMYDLGARPDRPTIKCARVVGEVMGKYHPHGDAAIYASLVRMGQSFSLRDPLIEAKGNFGYSPDDSPAAPRYTECRLDQRAIALLDGIDENTVDFIDNYSGEFREPEVLPARIPNLLVNGCQGIAVGLATNIPTHNLGECIDATVHLLDNPEATINELIEIIPGGKKKN